MALLRLAANERDDANVTPAAAALHTLRDEIAELQAQDGAWAEKENAEVDHVRLCASEQAVLAALQQRRIAAQADREVLGRTAEDVAALTRDIEAARGKVGVAVERAELAEAKLVRIRDQRAALREQQIKLNQQLRPLQHAARKERLGVVMPTLLAAEAAYVQALQEAYGTAAAIDELARGVGIQLSFAGQLNLADLILPRPYHEAYTDRPSPLRVEIGQAIAAVAERVSKEL